MPAVKKQSRHCRKAGPAGGRPGQADRRQPAITVHFKGRNVKDARLRSRTHDDENPSPHTHDDDDENAHANFFV